MHDLISDGPGLLGVFLFGAPVVHAADNLPIIPDQEDPIVSIVTIQFFAGAKTQRQAPIKKDPSGTYKPGHSIAPIGARASVAQFLASEQKALNTGAAPVPVHIDPDGVIVKLQAGELKPEDIERILKEDLGVTT